MSASALALEPSALSPTSAMASESSFPLEIYEHILDFVAEDISICRWKRTLANASLVCRGWHPRSRALLFRVMRFVTADEDTLVRYRNHLAVAPRLAAYIEEVRLMHRPYDGRLLESFPRWLGIYLPRLRAVFVKLTRLGKLLNMHHFFCLPRVRVHSVRTLEYDSIRLWNTSEFEGLLLPYPNARILTLHMVWWMNIADMFQCKGLPRPLKTPLALTEIRLMLYASGKEYIHLGNRLGYEYLLQACKETLVKLLLNIIPIRVLVLDFPGSYPLNVIDFPCLDVLHLEIFVTPTSATIFEDKDGHPSVPYSEVDILILSLLRRINAVGLRILRLSFSAADVDQAPDRFVEYLAAMHEPLAELIFGSWFPNLKAIVLDLGCRSRNIPWWQSQISKCFPKLEKVVSVQVMQHDHLSEDIRSDGRHEFYYGS